MKIPRDLISMVSVPCQPNAVEAHTNQQDGDQQVQTQTQYLENNKINAITEVTQIFKDITFCC
jgi:hypothetical protein